MTINLADELERHLATGFGGNLSRAALEAHTVESYRRELISLGKLAEVLGLSIDQAPGLLKSRSVSLTYSVKDFDSDVSALGHSRRP
jgi:predicted HTH domain antitoxin